jgi:hypothetical protein
MRLARVASAVGTAARNRPGKIGGRRNLSSLCAAATGAGEPAAGRLAPAGAGPVLGRRLVIVRGDRQIPADVATVAASGRQVDGR